MLTNQFNKEGKMEKENNERLKNEHASEDVNKKEEVVDKERHADDSNKRRPGCNRAKCFCAR
ncbi:hypothetical protein H2Y56_04060 [Pectobacterium aroidearum]|uniref:Uncharacterized protein n=2 Tax=Pectobacteriaceae TaxID=1903410 RepID=A0ABR5Z9P2_9GAMM|nr:hypothetical protein [Pectobacterium aroidearum]MBA5226995.1 hypothetical protein [Pectobacterium aroidearum]MBA5231292.1 hypothetical protein [Pectobacterium aroidearum]MBA5736439.1 hypothetical protein [Pectobacterium aroidearum]GKV93053.1 hypothetical protein PEC301645_05000 [Pectobacterium carotovorum subsp. carotovorum]